MYFVRYQDEEMMYISGHAGESTAIEYAQEMKTFNFKDVKVLNRDDLGEVHCGSDNCS